MSNNGNTPQKLLTISEVKERLNVSLSTIERLIRKGKLPFFKLEGQNKRFIKESAVDLYIKNSQR